MLSAFIVGCGLMGAVPADSGPSADDLKTYNEARAQAKRDPSAHVKLALWCEAHSMNSERLKHLAIALLVDRMQDEVAAEPLYAIRG